jgi:hypothetical protein
MLQLFFVIAKLILESMVWTGTLTLGANQGQRSLKAIAKLSHDVSDRQCYAPRYSCETVYDDISDLSLLFDKIKDFVEDVSYRLAVSIIDRDHELLDLIAESLGESAMNSRDDCSNFVLLHLSDIQDKCFLGNPELTLVVVPIENFVTGRPVKVPIELVSVVLHTVQIL